MTRSELAAWCVTVTEPPTVEEPMSETPLEAVRSAYQAREAAARDLRDRSTELVATIREARETHSLAEIAQELGVSRQRIHQIERQER